MLHNWLKLILNIDVYKMHILEGIIEDYTFQYDAWAREHQLGLRLHPDTRPKL